MVQLYKNIRDRRNELGLTQTDLALKLGYADKSMIAKIEKGLVDLSQSKVMAFAEALEMSASELMGWADDDSSIDAVSKDRSLSEDEVALLDDYQKLNSYGKEKAREYLSDLTDNVKYTDKGESSSLSGVG